MARCPCLLSRHRHFPPLRSPTSPTVISLLLGMPAAFVFPRSCAWPASSAPRLEPSVLTESFLISSTRNATAFCDAQFPQGPLQGFAQELQNTCNVLVAHHKSGTVLLRSLRNELMGILRPGSPDYRHGRCDDELPPQSRAVHLWCGHCGRGGPGMHRCDGANLTSRVERALIAGCRVVHVVRAPKRLVASQHLYEARLAAVGAYDTLSHKHRYYSALRAGNWRAMWRATWTVVRPHVELQEALLRDTLERHDGCSLTLDLDGDFGRHYDASVMKILTHLAPRASARTVCELILRAARHDVTRPSLSTADMEARSGTHVAPRNTTRAAEDEMRALTALGERWEASGSEASLEQHESTFAQYMDVLRGSAW
jgi:hypothetical protein